MDLSERFRLVVGMLVFLRRDRWGDQKGGRESERKEEALHRNLQIGESAVTSAARLNERQQRVECGPPPRVYCDVNVSGH